ncbi:hypothetical protein [Marisediminicola antarctica]|nr:hypothetical protein [Marisediminicola antarctica]
MKWRLVAFGAVAACSLAGCSVSVPTGSVSIEIGADADARLGTQFPVTITSSDDQAVVDEVMVRGDFPTFEDILLGEVTIDIGGACLFKTDLTVAGASVTVHQMNCSLWIAADTRKTIPFRKLLLKAGRAAGPQYVDA